MVCCAGGVLSLVWSAETSLRRFVDGVVAPPERSVDAERPTSIWCLGFQMLLLQFGK